MKRRLIALAAERKAALDAAQAALEANKQEEYAAQMEKAANMLTEINNIKNLLEEQERQILTATPSEAEIRDMAEERGTQLQRGEIVNFSAQEVLRNLRNQLTITGTLVQPTGGASEINGNGPAVPSIIDMVQVEDLTGLGGYEVPFLISEQAAQPASITAKSGVARTASDPSFGIAQISPYEVTVTSYIDRNISKLSPARYYEKVQSLAMQAMRRKVTELICNGDSETTHIFQGIKGAKSKAGTSIIATGDYSAITVDTLDDLYFAYGADSELGGEAVLQLTKADLKAIGQLRGTNEKQRLFKITPSGNGNTGMIADGGVQIPYVLVPSLTAGDLIYGNPQHFLLGLFGGFEVRVDESVKAVERMHTILGDVAVGGNVVVNEGFVYYSKKSGT